MNVFFTLWRDEKKIVKNSFSFCGTTTDIWTTCYQMHMCCYVDGIGVCVLAWSALSSTGNHLHAKLSRHCLECAVIEYSKLLLASFVYQVEWRNCNSHGEKMVSYVHRQGSTDIHMWRWCETSLYCSTPIQRIDISWHIAHLPFGGSMTIIQSGYKPS